MAGGEYPWERPLGAVPGGDGTVEFRVWAPHPERVDVRVGGTDHALSPEGHGIRSARVQAKAVARRADLARAGGVCVAPGGGRALPAPVSRWQPEGLRGPSRVVDPGDF